MNARTTTPARDYHARGHERDEHCDVDPETDLCRACGVHHDEPCGHCGGRGFHTHDECPGMLSWW